MHAWGGSKWQAYQKMFLEGEGGLLANQEEDGSWKTPGGGAKILAVAPLFSGEGSYAVHYRTCLCVLTLQCCYRDETLRRIR